MDKITLEDISPQTERELTSPLSPKRPRTDCTVTNNHSGKSRFDFPELLTFRKTIGSPSPTSTLQKNAGLVSTAECGDIENEKPHEQPQDTKLIAPPVTKLTTSHTDDAHTGSSKVCFIAAQRRFLFLVKDEQPPITETDKLSSYPVDDAGGALAESHTSKDASTDTSSHPDCKWLGKSLEDEPPGGCNLPAGNDEDGRQVQNSVSQIQAFTLSSSDEEVRCRCDCTCEETLHDTSFCNTWSQSAEVEESNQKRDEYGFSENILFSNEKEEGNCPISSSDYADSKTFYSNHEEEPSGNLAEGVKNEEKILELQLCENENVAVCDGETKGQVNENGMSKNSIPSAAECAEGSIVAYDMVLVRNIAIENVSLEAEDFCGAKGEHPAGKMIAKARSETADHTTETPMPARISQEPAEGDNDAGPFSVIDPAIWSETDREAEVKLCNSENIAGVELSPPVKVCKMEMRLPLCSDRPSQEVSAPDQTGRFNHQSGTQQCKDEKEYLPVCESYTEPQACSITTSETHNKIGNEGSCHWKASPSSSPCSPAKSPPAGDGRQESHDTMGHQLNEQDQSGCFPVSLDHLKTQKVEYLEIELARMDEATEMTSSEEEIRTDVHGKSETPMGLEGKLLQQNKKHKEDTTEMSTGDCINDWTDGKISKYDNGLAHIDEELGNNLEFWSDHQYNAVIPTMEGTTVEKERKEEASVGEETDVHGNSESEDGHQQQSQQKGDMTKASPDEWTEGNLSKSGNKLTLVSQHEQGNKISCFSDNQHRAETFMVENKDDLLAFTFPPTSDAVVPGPHEFIHSQNADNPTALNCSDRFSPVPSAFTFYDCVLGTFDTFERMQLPLDDDDDYAGLSNSPLLTSLPGQLLKTPQQQLYHSMPEAESNEHEEVPEEKEEEEEEEEERFECHTENMANGFLSSDYSCNELPNFISAADVIALGWPEQQPNGESACPSSDCFQDDLNPQSMSPTVSSKSDQRPASDVNDSPKFEMKKQFDMVLKELNLYFDISISDFASDSRASSPEQCTTEALESDTSACKEHQSNLDLGRHRDTSSDDADEDRSLDMCGGDPVVSCTSFGGDGEQEVPYGSHLCQEASMNTAEKHREPREMEQKRKMWSPSFMCQPFLEQLSQRPPEQPRRLEPLRTCTRPFRVGLSKRAKTKHLHRPHPYK
ncbi:uncharacterized protein LOC122863691 [Siniperca chuatsi]|uniref:uncharacterized protein LOC122863691 n=1 Tax=Siniperca chuatsi TaxID=119488 RepID=UPI001CE04DF0|nr:uncharacterized protein LOC122863691 [Siniperca chuatsi]XP_044026348.1 uncharacterized protein LOC122863691 [Siniperca chuatsi]XP_044026349.1 uncharacterized protein LOC122863691 [Siniperca chuatsi]